MGDFGGIAALGSVEKDTAKQPNDKDTLADVSPTSFLKGSDIMSDQSTEAFLLGLAMAGLDSVQKHLIQDENKEALSVVNEVVRKLNAEVQKHFYSPKEKEIPNDAPQC